MQATIFAHVVNYNSGAYLKDCIGALLEQELPSAYGVEVHLTDNASSAFNPEEFCALFGCRINIRQNRENLGFCAAHNQAVNDFLQSEHHYFLILNPDLRLERNSLAKLLEAIELAPDIGQACPKLLRADEELAPLEPRRIDAAGMYITSSLRHLDRGSGELDRGQFEECVEVFGASGACILMKRNFVEKLLLDSRGMEAPLDSIYPQLKSGREQRAPLFDEAFFAYREDADLAWRAQLLAWKCVYVPSAVGYHKRFVLPELRKKLPGEINLMGVRNRYLLQLNNYTAGLGVSVFCLGVILRNVVVFFAVLLRERSSVPALYQTVSLAKRAQSRRRNLLKRVSSEGRANVAYWFRHTQRRLKALGDK